MTRAPRRASVAAAAVAAIMLAAGCGSTTAGSHSTTAPGAVPPSSLDTAMATAAGTLAVTVMGGPAAQYNNFWQLFIRPAGGSRWKLVTPPGTADNGGLVLAAGGPTLITAFRPSQALTYTPLTQSRDGGQAWSALSPLDAPLADTADALAIAPAHGALLALLTDGTAEQAGPGSATWKTLANPRTLAVTPAGRRCGLQALTAVAYTSSGVPLLAGTCSHEGSVGIFAAINGTWQAAGPAIPVGLARQHITVLRLIRTANQIMAVLAVGSGHAASVLAAWSADNGHRWTLSPTLRLRGEALTSASFGPAGTVALITGAHTARFTSAGSQWHALPVLPPGTKTLVPGPDGQTQALAVHRATLTVWQLPPGGGHWAATQVISVPIQFGSSG